MESVIDILFSNSVAHIVFVLASVIALGIALGRLKIAGVGFGATGILFVAIIFSHFGLTIDERLLHFIKEFGLILFIYSIGLQVGPGFFSSLKKGGLRLNQLALILVLLGVGVTIALHYITSLPMSTMVGIMSGAVTNTPGLGAAGQTLSESVGAGEELLSELSTGYALAYPLGVVGAILTIVLLKYLFRVDTAAEQQRITATLDVGSESQRVTLKVLNEGIDGYSVAQLQGLSKRDFVVSRICRPDGSVALVDASTTFHKGDRILLIANNSDIDALIALIGERDEVNWFEKSKDEIISRRILITRSELNGKPLSSLKVRTTWGVNITRVNRAGIDLIPKGELELQVGDKLTVVGPQSSVAQTEKVFGNSLKRLNHPNLIPIFIGIALGVVLGSIPIAIPGIPQPVKLGLAGGPLIVAILIGRFGPHYKLVTYTTMSANLMLREVGISLFLASVGLGAGESFFSTLLSGGYMWILYGAFITIIPILITGVIGRLLFKLNYFTLIGVIAGASTNPPLLSFASDQTTTDAPSVAYATVYPLSMFMRVIAAQMMILLFC